MINLLVPVSQLVETLISNQAENNTHIGNVMNILQIKYAEMDCPDDPSSSGFTMTEY
jgi:hypothetical protein